MCMSLTICCVGGVCQCCCCALSCLGSSVTRLTYTIGLLLAAIAAWVLRNWGSQMIPEELQQCSGDCFNYLGVYRISMGFVLYHAALCLFTIGVTTSKYPRAKFHNGWWPAKAVIYLGITAGCFFVPESFFPAYAIMSIVGGILFLIIQTIIILDFAYGWAESWVEKWEASNEPLWRVTLIGTTVVCYGIAVAASIVLYVFYTIPGPYQGLNIFFITFNLVLVVVGSIGSILPIVQEANPRSGLLQAAIIGAYITYVIASAIASQPKGNGECTPSNSDTFSQVLFYCGFAATFGALCLNAFSTTSSDQTFSGATGDDADDEQEGTKYKYWFLHLVMVLAGFYMAALLTNWAVFNGEAFTGGDFCVDQGIGSMWAKAATSWVVALLFIWTLMAPVLFPGRFGND